MKKESIGSCANATAEKSSRLEDRRNNNWLSYNGETHTMSEWAEITGIDFHTLWRRQRRGWDDERILTAPLRMTKRHKKKEGE